MTILLLVFIGVGLLMAFGGIAGTFIVPGYAAWRDAWKPLIVCGAFIVVVASFMLIVEGRTT